MVMGVHASAICTQKRVRGKGGQISQNHFLLIGTHSLHSFAEPVLITLLHLFWMDIPANEPLIFMETANYNANVTKLLREIQI